MQKLLIQTTERWRRFLAWASRFVASNTFFYIILGVFVFQALWIIFSGAYSMAYDEYYHLGLIKEYAHQGTPFLQQPAGPAELGAVARDVSFLFHYLMSFPYRFVNLFTAGQTAHIIVLRLLCLIFFVGGLFAYRVTLLRAGLSRRIVHSILFVFSIVPTVVMVAAQLNYDNLLFLIAGLALMTCTTIVQQLHAKKTPSLLLLVGAVTLLLAGSVTQYVFLPLALAMGLFTVAKLFMARWSVDWGDLLRQARRSLRRPTAWVILICFVFVSFMFIERVGGNVIRYHTPVPDCDQVLSVTQCMGHDPYERNQHYKDANYAHGVTVVNKLTYPWKWYTQMVRESFFAVGPREANYATGAPLPLAYWSAMVILPIMGIAILLRLKSLWRQSAALQLFLVVVVSYGAILFWRNFTDYTALGIPVAIHGRYIIYSMPLLAALAAVALRSLIPVRMRQIAAGILLVLVILLILGGGWLPFIIRSADNWLWPWAVDANRALRSLLWPFIIR